MVTTVGTLQIIPTIQLQATHGSITVIERYAHLEPSAVREVVAVLADLQSQSGHTGRSDNVTDNVLTLVKG